MKYETKFDFDQTVCFKDVDDGVMQGKVIGLSVTSDLWNADEPPSEYDWRTRVKAPTEVTYLVLVRHTTSGSKGLMRRVSEGMVALTFEDAWKLA